MFLIALVLFGKNLFQPLCLPFSHPLMPFCHPLIRRHETMTYEELLAAAVAPEGPHLLETYCFLLATLLYRHRPHLWPSWSRHVESRCPAQLYALLTEAFEVWFLGVRCVATFQAGKPTYRARQHGRQVITQNTVWAAHYLVSHFEPSAPSLCESWLWLRLLKL